MDGQSLIQQSIFDFWNKKVIEPPDFTPLVVSQGAVHQVRKLLKRIYSTLKNDEHLTQETALVVRLVYKMKLKFRHDKGLATLDKIKRCLQNYVELNLKDDIESVFNNCFDDKGPSRQLAKWLLIKFMGFASLFHRLKSSVETAARLFLSRIRQGHMWTVAVACLASISRIWAISQFMMSCAVDWFDSLVKLLPLLGVSDTPWSLDSVDLPQGLDSWLGISKPAPSMIEVEKFLNTQQESKEPTFHPSTFDRLEVEDVGEIVSRENFDSSPAKKMKNANLANGVKKRKMIKKRSKHR